MNIAYILSEQSQTCGQEAAIIDTYRGKPRTTSFVELDLQAARVAALLQQQGLHKGDAVLVFQPMSVELYVVLAALFRLGLIAMFIDPSAGRERLEQCCAIYPPKALIASRKAHLLRVLSPALRRIPLKFVIGGWVPGAVAWRRARDLPAHETVTPVDEATPALLTFTSGSTGLPKAAMRSHGFLVAQHQALAKSLHYQRGERDMTNQPIFVLANLASGLTSILPDADLRRPDAMDAAPVLRQIEKEQPDRLSASPAFFEQLLDYAELHQLHANRVKFVFTGGAPVFPRLLQALQSFAPEAVVTAVYGSTEAEPIAHCSWQTMTQQDIEAMLEGKGLVTGKPTEDITLRIIRMARDEVIPTLTQKKFDAMTLVAGEIGEIVVSGAHVLHGYWQGRGDEETKFDVAAERWHRTGDAGYLDDEGRLWLLGRCAALIEDAQGSLYPFTVECAAYQHEAVKRVAVVQHQGKRLLVIEAMPGQAIDKDGLLSSLSWAKLADVWLVDKMPVDKRHNAKIDYPALRQLLAKR